MVKFMIKIRIGNYRLARIIDGILRFFWWRILKRGIHFEEVTGLNYEGKEVDVYYLIQLK